MSSGVEIEKERALKVDTTLPPKRYSEGVERVLRAQPLNPLVRLTVKILPRRPEFVSETLAEPWNLAKA